MIFGFVEDHVNIVGHSPEGGDVIMWPSHLHKVMEPSIVNNADTLHAFGDPANTFNATSWY